MSLKPLHLRRFLNKREGIAFIEVFATPYKAEYDKTNPRKLQQGPRFECSVTIGDCTRNVTLDFDIYSSYHPKDVDKDKQKVKQHYLERVEKLDYLLDALTRVRAHMKAWAHENKVVGC
jgi:hypothetical protein